MPRLQRIARAVGVRAARNRCAMRGISSKLTTPCPNRLARACRTAPSALVGIGEADEGGRARARVREQFQRRGGDDPERALGADEEVLQVVAGVVLAQLRERVDDAPVGAARPRRRSPVRARCHRRAPRRRRRWSRDCRRSCRCPRRRARAETAGRRARAAACASASVTPASTIIVSVSGSISRMRFSRCSERTISRPLASGVWPPTSPVLPPCGTIGDAAPPRRRRRPRRLPPSSPAAPAPARGRDRARAARSR